MEAAQLRGLPIAVGVPPNMGLRPGELVDLTLLVGAKIDARPVSQLNDAQ